MKTLCKLDLSVVKDAVPSGWLIEYNSNLGLAALACDGRSVDLLSSGNKYIPITPPVENAVMKMKIGFNFSMAKCCSAIVSFRYDLAARTGEAVRFVRLQNEQGMTFEYGKMSDNLFQPEAKAHADMPDSELDQALDFIVELKGKSVLIRLGSGSASFATKPGRPGRFALSRGHFFDVLRVYDLEISTDDSFECLSERKFRVDLPHGPTLYPVHCDVTLRDYGDCLDAGLVFSGGVPESPMGEGNYHVMRADLLTNLFLKVVTKEAAAKYILRAGRIVLVNPWLAPGYFFKVLHRETPWPFHASVRFMKPEGPFDLAVGADTYEHTTAVNQAQSPSETVFDLDGRELYAGLALTERAQKIEFTSQPDKEIIADLPKTDPRYGQAVEFAKNNHFFKEGEPALFTVVVTAFREMPAGFDLVLEDAFLRTLRKLDYARADGAVTIGVRSYAEARLACRVEGLKPGVYHLRAVSADGSVTALEDYCAFEVMSRAKGALPPPLLSGLPYLYCSRTETIGLMTDAFDPWFAKSADERHYMACANFLPRSARDFHVAPTVHAYQREWFLWLGTRCAEQYLAKDNMDLIAEADYVNVHEEVRECPCASLLWATTYKGKVKEELVKFLDARGDAAIDRQKLKAAEHIDGDMLCELGRRYWSEWLDWANKFINEDNREFMRGLRKCNPGLKPSKYGPAHIYASHYKGVEYIRYLGSLGQAAEEFGFWQYEDYPFLCRYNIERGTYFLASCLLAMPGHRIYPEIYTTSIQGCPDGAVFYAHPPFGYHPVNPPIRIKRRFMDYYYGSAHFTGDGFGFWEKRGFQACGFDRERYEALLRAAAVVNDNPAKRPLKCAAFVFSEESWQAAERVLAKSTPHGIVDIRKTATECVPYAYEMARYAGLQAGFVTMIESVGKLDPAQVDTLVLPPLKGVSKPCLDAIRRLHAQGVNLLAFENVPGLEDLFGVKDTGAFARIENLKASDSFLGGMTETCEEPLCEGSYAVDGAEVLINSEIPVLTLRRNNGAQAAFYNVPPTLVRGDQLHKAADDYGKDSISRLINAATARIMTMFSDAGVSTTAGRLTGSETLGGGIMVTVGNPDEKSHITPTVTIRKLGAEQALYSSDMPCTVLSDSGDKLALRVNIPAEETAVIVVQ